MTLSSLPSFPPRRCDICGEEDRHFLKDSEVLICFECWESGLRNPVNEADALKKKRCDCATCVEESLCKEDDESVRVIPGGLLSREEYLRKTLCGAERSRIQKKAQDLYDLCREFPISQIDTRQWAFPV